MLHQKIAIGCVLSFFVHGLLITFLPAMSMVVFSNFGFTNTTFSDADFSALAVIFGNLINVAPIIIWLATKNKTKSRAAQ